MAGQKLGQFRAAFAIIRHHLDNTRGWFIGHCCFENRPIRTANQLSTVVEGEVIVW